MTRLRGIAAASLIAMGACGDTAAEEAEYAENCAKLWVDAQE